jgi:hypothetical protein
VADVDDEDDRPWEQPGAFRLDCEPHRGDMLFFLARLSVSLSCVSLCMVPLAVVGLPLGIVVLLLSARDLRQMDLGLMDPGGGGSVRAARRNAAWATGIAPFAALAWTWLVLWRDAGRLALVPLSVLFVVGVMILSSEPWRSKRAPGR